MQILKDIRYIYFSAVVIDGNRKQLNGRIIETAEGRLITSVPWYHKMIIVMWLMNCICQQQRVQMCEGGGSAYLLAFKMVVIADHSSTARVKETLIWLEYTWSNVTHMHKHLETMHLMLIYLLLCCSFHMKYSSFLPFNVFKC